MGRSHNCGPDTDLFSWSPVVTHGPEVYEELVALTGIEPEGCQFSLVQLGLSSCVSVQVVFQDGPKHLHKPATSQRSHSVEESTSTISAVVTIAEA
jgi:hypothetical protein